MKEAGCRLLIVGFESGNPDILTNIKKGATVEQARQFMKHCKEVGLVVHGDFQVGLPGETKETIDAGVVGERFYLQTGGDTKMTKPLRTMMKRSEGNARPPQMPEN